MFIDHRFFVLLATNFFLLFGRLAVAHKMLSQNDFWAIFKRVGKRKTRRKKTMARQNTRIMTGGTNRPFCRFDCECMVVDDDDYIHTHTSTESRNEKAPKSQRTVTKSANNNNNKYIYRDFEESCSVSATHSTVMLSVSFIFTAGACSHFIIIYCYYIFVLFFFIRCCCCSCSFSALGVVTAAAAAGVCRFIWSGWGGSALFNVLFLRWWRRFTKRKYWKRESSIFQINKW